MKGLTKVQLDEATNNGCGYEDCNHDHGMDKTLFIHSRCHMGGRIEVSYVNQSGVLRVGCKECGELIVNIKVAEE